jgi:hypothetical protein
MIFGAATLVAVAGAAFFVFRSEQQIATLKSTLRAFDLQMREATDLLAELRLGQQAYVAEGQGGDFWMSKVATLHESATAKLTALRHSPVSAATSTSLDEALATLGEFANIDRRTRDYINAHQSLMAADIIFTEGRASAAAAARYVETARQAEHQAFDLAEASLRKDEAIAVGGAAGLAVLVVLLLTPRPRTPAAVETADIGTGRSITSIAPPPVVATPPSAQTHRHGTVLKAAASLATDLGRVRDADEMRRLLSRAATLMDASGVLILLGDTTASSLQPVLAHGYSAEALSRMQPVPRSADNAAAAAYRTGKMQIVLSQPGGAAGAVVAPILAAEGCVGALSAEIHGGGEASDSVQALATIVAAQLATMVGETRSAAEPRTAAQG